MHLVIFVCPQHVEAAQAALAQKTEPHLAGAEIVPSFAEAWHRLPRWARRMQVTELEDAGIRNIALLSVGGAQLLEAVHA